MRLILIIFGVIVILLLMLLRRKKYKDIPVWKGVLLEFLSIIAGVIGTQLMFFIENGYFGGSSLFGAVLFMPVFILPALFMRLSYKDILNLCAPAVGAMLTIMKFECWFKGCCFGKYLPSLRFQFPSQLVEAGFCVFLTVALLIIEARKRDAHLYAWLLIFYGATRLLLNGFRYGVSPFIWNLSIGQFWGLISVIVGIGWIICASAVVARRKNLKDSAT